jgi:hypothetical protein
MLWKHRIATNTRNISSGSFASTMRDFAIIQPRWKAGKQMKENITEAQQLLDQIIGHVNGGTHADTRQAAAKWARIAAIASTSAITLQVRH